MSALYHPKGVKARHGAECSDRKERRSGHILFWSISGFCTPTGGCPLLFSLLAGGGETRRSSAAGKKKKKRAGFVAVPSALVDYIFVLTFRGRGGRGPSDREVSERIRWGEKGRQPTLASLFVDQVGSGGRRGGKDPKTSLSGVTPS